MKTLFALALISFFFSASTFANPRKVAVVKILKGEVDVLTLGKTTKLKTEDWVEDGAVVKTAEKSFVKLVFVDKSQMNIGPNSEMKIEKFDGKDSGVIDLVKGKIRSQVTKDYLQIQDKDKSKLFIKTPNAVMGIRGTDFMISTNGKNTSAVLFEGEVVFNRLDARHETSSNRLEEMVDRGVRMFPGEFSVVEANRPQPTVPSLLNVRQKETLEKNDSFETDRGPSNSGEEAAAKSVVPAGLTGDTTANSSEVLKTEVAQVAPTEPQGPGAAAAVPASKDANGFIDGDKVKPTNGSFLHVDSGIIIAPGADAVLDTNTNTYIPTASSGTVGGDGSYVPPKNMEITNDGKILVSVTDQSGKLEVKEVPPPPPVKPEAPVVTSPTGPAPMPAPLPTTPLEPPPPTNDILTTGSTSTTILSPTTTTTTTNDLRLNNQIINQTTGTATTIRVKPQ